MSSINLFFLFFSVFLSLNNMTCGYFHSSESQKGAYLMFIVVCTRRARARLWFHFFQGSIAFTVFSARVLGLNIHVSFTVINFTNRNLFSLHTVENELWNEWWCSSNSSQHSEWMKVWKLCKQTESEYECLAWINSSAKCWWFFFISNRMWKKHKMSTNNSVERKKKTKQTWTYTHAYSTKISILIRSSCPVC